MINYDEYDYLSPDEIMKAVEGDSDAFKAVMTRYDHYAKKCLLGIANAKYGFKPESLPDEDLMQEIWFKLSLVIKKFECEHEAKPEEK